MVDKDALVRSYAEALFRLAEAEGELDAVERQLFAFAALLERETRVRDALVDPSLPPENKKQLIADALGERANPLALNLLGFVIELGRAREVGRIVEALAEVVAATRERAVAEVRTAIPLDEAPGHEAGRRALQGRGSPDRDQGHRRPRRARWRAGQGRRRDLRRVGAHTPARGAGAADRNDHKERVTRWQWTS